MIESIIMRRVFRTYSNLIVIENAAQWVMKMGCFRRMATRPQTRVIAT